MLGSREYASDPLGTRIWKIVEKVHPQLIRSLGELSKDVKLWLELDG